MCFFVFASNWGNWATQLKAFEAEPNDLLATAKWVLVEKSLKILFFLKLRLPQIGAFIKSTAKGGGAWWWYSGQRSCILLRWSEFESCWLPFFCTLLLQKDKNKRKIGWGLLLKKVNSHGGGHFWFSPSGRVWFSAYQKCFPMLSSLLTSHCFKSMQSKFNRWLNPSSVSYWQARSTKKWFKRDYTKANIKSNFCKYLKMHFLMLCCFEFLRTKSNPFIRSKFLFLF